MQTKRHSPGVRVGRGGYNSVTSVILDLLKKKIIKPNLSSVYMTHFYYCNKKVSKVMFTLFRFFTDSFLLFVCVCVREKETEAEEGIEPWSWNYSWL